MKAKDLSNFQENILNAQGLLKKIDPSAKRAVLILRIAEIFQEPTPLFGNVLKYKDAIEAASIIVELAESTCTTIEDYRAFINFLAAAKTIPNFEEKLMADFEKPALLPYPELYRTGR